MDVAPGEDVVLDRLDLRFAPARGSVRLEAYAGDERVADIDELGGFRFTGVPSGLARLHVDGGGIAVTTSGGATVTTIWLAV